MSLYLRSANERDMRKIFDWANDDVTRANSFHTEKITWEEHEAWYRKVMESEDVKLYVAMDFMKPVGQVRLNLENETGVISYSVDEDYRGRHIGQKMLMLLEKEAAGKVKRLTAKVKAENAASIRIFECLGYQVQPESDEHTVVYMKDLENTDSTIASMKNTEHHREPSFEILRVVAMLMVILLHYLSKGGLLADPASAMSGSDKAFWVLEALSVVCVNVYVLISGYFLTESRFKLGKVAYLWCQVFFYSIVVAAVAMAVGIVDYHQYMDLFNLQFLVFPIVNGHYWFATAYILMYIFSPFMSHAVRNMKKENLAWLICLLLIPCCLAKSVLPVPLKADDLGNGVVWFLCLYLIAAYIRLYGIPFLEKKFMPLITYCLSAVLILTSLAAAAAVVRLTGSYQYALEIPMHYNFIFVLTGALGLFYCFKNLKVKDNILVRYLVRIAPYTFGVYLLHEHLFIRYWWVDAMKVSESYGAARILHILLCVVIIFTVGILVDFLRSLLFKVFDKLIVIALRIYYAKQEAMDYLIFGVFATVVNWVVYLACAYIFFTSVFGDKTVRAMAANVTAWVAAVLFAYWTNRTFVFRSHITGFKEIMKEFVSFVSARIVTFLIESLMFFVMIDWLHINDLISKLIISIVVIILNYVFSKLWIFKKKAD